MPLVCTIDNAIDVFLAGLAIGAFLGAVLFGILAVISKWNSL